MFILHFDTVDTNMIPSKAVRRRRNSIMETTVYFDILKALVKDVAKKATKAI
jgi:hypothetical protein